MMKYILTCVVFSFSLSASAQNCPVRGVTICNKENTNKYSVTGCLPGDYIIRATLVKGTPFFGYDDVPGVPTVFLRETADGTWVGSKEWNSKTTTLAIDFKQTSYPFTAKITRTVTSKYARENEFITLDLGADLCINDCSGINCSGVD